MSFKTEHKQKFDELRFALDVHNKTQLKAKANGGNCILFSYPPVEEEEYINELKSRYGENVSMIYINKLFVEFIDKTGGWEDFEEYYFDYKDTPHIIFKPDNNNDPGLFEMIIDNIKKVANENKIPVLVRTGALDGTGIENVNIMENSEVMGLSVPLVIFYPSKIEADSLLFLNYRPASKYRCILI